MVVMGVNRKCKNTKIFAKKNLYIYIHVFEHTYICAQTRNTAHVYTRLYAKLKICIYVNAKSNECIQI